MSVSRTRTLIGTALWASVLAVVTPAPALAQSQPSSGAPDRATQAQDEQPAAASSWGPLRGRLAFHVNGAFQPSSRQIREIFAFRAYGEDASFRTRYDIDGSSLIDLGGHVRVWRQLAVGATYTQLTESAAAVVTGSVPHPIDFNRPRSIEPQRFALAHEERTTHVHVTWVVPVHERLDVAVFGGPSFFNLRQGVVTNATATEAGGPPFATVTVDISTGEHTRNGVGGHVGADVTYMPTSYLGVGFLVRFATASVDLPPSGPDFDLRVGGVHVGAGVRARF